MVSIFFETYIKTKIFLFVDTGQLTYSNAFANLGHVRPEIGTFEKLYQSRDGHFHVTGAKLWIRRRDGRPALGG